MKSIKKILGISLIEMMLTLTIGVMIIILIMGLIVKTRKNKIVAYAYNTQQLSYYYDQYLNRYSDSYKTSMTKITDIAYINFSDLSKEFPKIDISISPFLKHNNLTPCFGVVYKLTGNNDSTSSNALTGYMFYLTDKSSNLTYTEGIRAINELGGGYGIYSKHAGGVIGINGLWYIPDSAKGVFDSSNFANQCSSRLMTIADNTPVVELDLSDLTSDLVTDHSGNYLKRNTDAVNSTPTSNNNTELGELNFSDSNSSDSNLHALWFAPEVALSAINLSSVQDSENSFFTYCNLSTNVLNSSNQSNYNQQNLYVLDASYLNNLFPDFNCLSNATNNIIGNSILPKQSDDIDSSCSKAQLGTIKENSSKDAFVCQYSGTCNTANLYCYVPIIPKTSYIQVNGQVNSNKNTISNNKLINSQLQYTCSANSYIRENDIKLDNTKCQDDMQCKGKGKKCLFGMSHAYGLKPEFFTGPTVICKSSVNGFCNSVIITPCEYSCSEKTCWNQISPHRIREHVLGIHMGDLIIDHIGCTNANASIINSQEFQAQ